MIESYKQITWRYLKANKKRTILTIVGVILSVALISSIGLFIKCMQDSEIDYVKNTYGSYHVAFTKVNDSLISKISNNPKVSRSGLFSQGEPIKLNDKISTNIITATDNALELLPIKAKEGRLPQNDNEVAIEKWILKYIDISAKVGSKVKINNKYYTLVGILENSVGNQMQSNGFVVTKSNNIGTGNAALLVEISPKAKLEKAVDELSKLSSSKSFIKNDHLLLMEGSLKDSATTAGIYSVVGVIIGIVLIATIAVIYNSFQISVVERMKQFGLLRAVGTTPKQIRNIVMREATFIIFIGVPIGLVCGIIAINGIALAFKIIGGDTVNFLKLSISPMILIISAVVGIASVYISALLPAFYAGKVSPLMAISSRASINKEKIKKRKNILVQKLFGFEGAMASKNIKRNKKRYRITVFSIALSVTLFISFKYFADMTVNITGIVNESSNIHFEIFSSNNNSGDNYFIDDKTIDSVNSINHVNTLYKVYKSLSYPAVMDKDKEVANIKALGNVYKDTIYQGKSSMLIDANINVYDENSINACKKYLKSGSIDMKALSSENGVILIEKSRFINRKTQKMYVGAPADIKVGDEIRLKKDGPSKVKVMAILKDDAFNFNGGENGLKLITTEDTAKKLLNKTSINPTGLYVTIDDVKNEPYVSDAIERIVKSNTSLEFINFVDENKTQKSGRLMIQILLYGFVIVVSLISSVNILNTLTTNIILRRKEFATLKSIGLTQKGLRKMIILEGLLYGIEGAIYGSIAGCALSYLLFRGMATVREFGYGIPWNAVFIAAGCALIIGYLSVLSPLARVKKDNLIETIREEY